MGVKLAVKVGDEVTIMHNYEPHEIVKAEKVTASGMVDTIDRYNHSVRWNADGSNRTGQSYGSRIELTTTAHREAIAHARACTRIWNLTHVFETGAGREKLRALPLDKVKQIVAHLEAINEIVKGDAQ